MISCRNHPQCALLYKRSGLVTLHDIYRVYLGKRQGQHIWIVDGDKVFCKLYPAFIMGGNDQRYRFNPLNEVWIDNRIAVEELDYTIAHELIERKLMCERLWSYERAHKEGLALEKRLRMRNMRRVANKENSTEPVTLGEWEDGLPRQLAGIRVPLDGVYRAFHGTVQGLAVWIVDGPKVRRDLYGDFCFGGHDLKYRFIPRNEIWLDSAMSAEQLKYTLLQELTERKLMASGKPYDLAYEMALAKQLDERERQARLVLEHEQELAPVSYGVRDRGAKKKGC